MKRPVLGVLALVAILSMVAIPTYAAPAETASKIVGPYEGTFQGVAYGESGSRASLTLELTHRGDDVVGKMSLGEGLHIDGGMCGEFDLPATVQYIEGQTSSGDPERLVASPSFKVSGFEVEVVFESKVLRNGDIIFARAEADLPWFCGSDPSLLAVLYRLED